MIVNPLSSFLPLEDRPDGVYIKADPRLCQSLSLPELCESLDKAGVLNYDADALSQIISRARNGFERIGPPFEYYRNEYDEYIEVAVQPMRATVIIYALPDDLRAAFSETILRHRLARAGVLHGIGEDVVKALVADPRYGTEIIIANGKPACDGEDGRIEFAIEIDPDNAPHIQTSGNVDFREIQHFVSVQQGQTIATRTPPLQGTAGMAVTGEAMPAQDGKESTLPQGKNTTITSDGERLIAEKTGIVYRDGRFVHVEELLNIPGDIDFSTGNVKFSGKVLVSGNVLPGFTVETDGDIVIKGEVESAKLISRQGSVIIEKGIIGKDDTFISGRESVWVDFAQNARIRSEGVLHVRKYCLHCHITCSALETENDSASIVGGEIIAYEHVDAGMLGNEKNVATLIRIVSKLRARNEEKLKDLRALKEKIDKQLELFGRELKAKTAMFKRAGDAVTQRHRIELKKALDGYNNMSMKQKFVEKKIVETKALIETPSDYNGYVRVRGKAYPGVEIELYGMGRRQIQDILAGKVFRLRDGICQSEG